MDEIMKLKRFGFTRPFSVAQMYERLPSPPMTNPSHRKFSSSTDSNYRRLVQATIPAVLSFGRGVFVNRLSGTREAIRPSVD